MIPMERIRRALDRPLGKLLGQETRQEQIWEGVTKFRVHIPYEEVELELDREPYKVTITNVESVEANYWEVFAGFGEAPYIIFERPGDDTGTARYIPEQRLLVCHYGSRLRRL